MDEENLDPIDLQKEDSNFIRAAYLLHEGLVMIQNNQLKWVGVSLSGEKKADEYPS